MQPHPPSVSREGKTKQTLWRQKPERRLFFFFYFFFPSASRMHSPVSLFETGGRVSAKAEERRKNERKKKR